MEKKRLIRTGIIGLAGAAIIGAGIFLATHVRIDGAFFSKSAAQYDLTNHDLSLEEYLEIRRQYPDKDILWRVPFQGTQYALDTEYIKISSLTKEEADTLNYLPKLQYVDADGCQDYEALLYLQQLRPECEILYYVPLGDDTCDSLRTTYTAENVTAAQLAEALPLLPRLERLGLSGTLPAVEELLKIRTDFPNVKLGLTLHLWGQDIHSDYRKLDLTGTSVSPQELSHVLPLFPDVEEVIFTGTPLSGSQYQALIQKHPGVHFLCDLEFAGKSFPTDSTEVDISGSSITVEEVEELLPYFPKLTKLIMSHCGIDDESMDALNRRYPDISIVWTLQIGLVTVRTDDLIFYPAGVNKISLPNNEELKKLRYCTEMIAVDVGHSKATECDWLEYMPHVKYLILADSEITDLSPLANLKELVYAELFSLDIQDYSPLLNCTALQDLNIGSTYGDIETIKQMTWLHNLWWHNAAEDPKLKDEVLKLHESLPDTNIVLKTTRNIGGMWRFLPNYYVFRELLGAGFFNQDGMLRFWDQSESKRILDCHSKNKNFAGDVLTDIIRYRIDNGMRITGIKNIGSEKAEVLYQTMVDSKVWYQQIMGETK